MANQFQDFLRVLKAFNAFELEYVLIGGVALILHGMERLTRDMDIFIQNNSENMQKLRKALNSIFHDGSIEEITKDELNKYSVIRYGTSAGFNIDLLTRIDTAFTYEETLWLSRTHRLIFRILLLKAIGACRPRKSSGE